MSRKIKEIRVYCECYEQGLYLLDYICNNNHLKRVKPNIVYTKPGNFSNYVTTSKVSQLLKHKDFDGLISLIDFEDVEHPIATIEFSSAVPTDDHILQRFDVMYWSTFYKVPCLKISPTKMVNTDFGGGNRIKIQHEYYATINMEGIYYHIEWPLIENTDLVMVDNEKVSCPPELEALKLILNNFVDTFFDSLDDNAFFENLFEEYKKYVNNNYNNDELIISNSTRYQFDSHGNLTMKINRFGHAMDPERGMLIFWSEKLKNKPVVKFAVQRESYEKYKSLYEGSNSAHILEIVKNQILSNNNIVTFDIAINLFKKATNTYFLFTNAKIINNTININDKFLLNNLKGSTSVVNNLLHFGEKIILNDLNDNTIAEIKWNNDLVKQFYMEQRNKALTISNKALPIQKISNADLNEDIVTYACMSLFMKNDMKNIAVSYPGAQGDRKILQGSGVTTKRDYIDIISIKKHIDDKYNVFLQENKRKISDTQRSDIDKLYSIRLDEDKMQCLNKLISDVYTPIIIKGCYIGVGGQESLLAQGETRFDYLMYIMINRDGNIEWSILSSNPIIFEIFRDIADRYKRLRGVIELLYSVNVVI
jgi:hypothetical protein